MEIFCKRLIELRKIFGYTQRDMANMLHISQPSYIRYELGTSEPTQQNLVNIANIFDVSLDYLLGRVDLWTAKNVFNYTLNKKHTKI